MKFLIFLLIPLLTVFAKAESALRPGITVSAQNEVRAGAPVYLKEIATFDYVNTEIKESAGNIVIYDSINDGEKLNLKNIDILKLVRTKLGSKADLAGFAWTYFVPETVSIKATKNFLSPTLITSDVTLALNKKCAECSIAIKDLKIPTIKEPHEVKHFEIEYESIKLGGSFIIPVSVVSEGIKKIYWITGVTKITKKGPVATRQINIGERITEKDFKFELVDVTFAKDGTPSAEELKNQVLGRSISINQPIFKADIRRELAVKRGQTIKVLAGTNDFEITSQGVADDQGYVGDNIKFKNSESQKWITGQIVEPGVVRVQ
jgi:flagella basal body P-ring formation protein FlgA